MGKTTKVEEFMAKLNHPLKAEMEAAIKIIREASPKLEEDVKWGGPSFDYKEPMATFNPRLTDFVAIIFHKGELLSGSKSFLEPGPKGKAYAKFRSMDDVEEHREDLAKAVDEWVKLMDAQ